MLYWYLILNVYSTTLGQTDEAWTLSWAGGGGAVKSYVLLAAAPRWQLRARPAAPAAGKGRAAPPPPPISAKAAAGSVEPANEVTGALYNVNY